MVDTTTTPEEIMDATAAEIVEDTTAAPEAPADTGLGINDISGAVSVIDICTKRGAFEGPELADVGALRNRLAAFVEAAQEPVAAAAEAPTA